MPGYRAAARVLVRCASSSTKKASKAAKPTKAAKATASKKSASSAAANKKTAAAESKYKTDVANEKGYYGRSVPYSNVHTSQLDAYYDLTLEMANKRLPQPRPANYTK
ncbi:hypothetical protein PTSG_09437 [Salpingoeca rosetta]|uniref:Uncharacterized protein n=1 Tax=Salpingoeca rosetta (strain ATCC 50818 / BSB-021) TaxID=946362 RepID=F2UMM1_SALR5|nr:uncharacterized protein PTSG_09437 [Salpingoeca rosetta]EGD78370.1 hypothetical protein PTSG_09437 [Salpingoeca rosetta]|eukprot:XP_004989693.1 hypothetical protein PTSG_09437 [Salpingoeca rosetta]